MFAKFNFKAMLLKMFTELQAPRTFGKFVNTVIVIVFLSYLASYLAPSQKHTIFFHFVTTNLILVQAEKLKVHCNSTVIKITSPLILNVFKFVKNVTNLPIYFCWGLRSNYTPID